MIKLHYFTFSSQYFYYLMGDPYIGGYSSSYVINEEAMLVETEVEIDSFVPISVSKVLEFKDYTIMGLCIFCALHGFTKRHYQILYTYVTII